MRKAVLIFGHNYATQFIDIYNQYTRLFDPEQYEVTVAYLTGAPSEEVKKRTLADDVVFLDLPKKSIRTLKIAAIKKLLELTRAKNFHTVICHRYKPIYIMMWVAQFHTIPALVFVLHELGTMSAWTRQVLIAGLARKNMVFAGVSDAVRDDLRKDLWCVPKERIVTLYNVLDVENTEPHLLDKETARKALGLSPSAFVFGNVARLARNKDQQNMITAFAKIKAHCPEAKLIILGDGELETPLKAQVASLGLTEDVIFAGFVASGYQYMKAFDCFVLSSIQEAFGRVLLEAMIAKLPVIATRVNGIPEVVADAGTLINAKDTLVLANAMKQIYAASASERSQIGLKAYEHVLKNFSLPAFAQQFWQVPLIKAASETL